MLEFGCNILQADIGYIAEKIEDFSVVQYIYTTHPFEITEMKVPLNKSVTYQIASQKMTKIRYDFEYDYSSTNHPPMKIRRYICTPIIIADKSIRGLVFLSTNSAAPEFTDSDIAIVELLAKIIEQTLLLKDRELLYRLIYEHNPSMSYVVDYEGIVLNISNLWEEWFGYNRDEVIGKDIFDFICSMSRQEFNRRFSEFNKQGYLYNNVINIRRKTGEIQEMESFSIRVDPTNEHSDIYVTLTDITDSNQAQRKLDYLWSCSNEIFVISNQEASFIQVNSAFSQILGYTLEDLKELTVFDLVHQEHYDHTFAAWNNVVTKQGVIDIEVRCLCKDGTYRWLLWRISSPFEQPVGNERIFAIVIDIHRQRLINEELLCSRQAALEASEAKSHFITSVSHELRTPLNSIIGFSNLLAEEPELRNSIPCSLYLERIHQNSTHLLKLIESILDISKIESGDSGLEINSICLNQLIAETVSEITGQALEKKLEIKALIPKENFFYQTDLFKLKQILINLLANAIKFTEEGTITVELIWNPNLSRSLSIQVTDTGIGIKEDELPKLFNKFYQVGKGYSRKHSGTGLGLYISKQLSVALGLELSVSSQFAKGSCFSIFFPKQPKIIYT
ncbi:MAG: hypothetical protein K0S74_671 [Chlamydiales bacterium]|nr:hypothetical protein [Chlamydiales bacterium]